MLVSLGAASFILAGQVLVGADSPNPTEHPDMSRLIQGVIGGIGFLGAGTIIQSRHSVKGVTTAAAVWLVAAIGTLCGLGLYITAAITTVLTVIILWLNPLEAAVFDHKDRKASPKRQRDEPRER
jgi:putative Mg2+ transporter-C (MgtC) family protein